MVKACCVLTCKQKMEKGKKSFFRVPSSATGYLKGQKLVCYERRRSVWLSRIFKNVAMSAAKERWVCADHFLLGRPSRLMEMDHPDWAPNQSIGDPIVAEEAKQQLDALNRGVQMTFCISDSTSTQTGYNAAEVNIKDIVTIPANVDKRDLIDITHVTKPSGVKSDTFIVCAMSKLDRSVATQTFSTYRDVGIQKRVLNKSVQVQTDLRCYDIEQNDTVVEKLQKRVNSLEVNEEFLRHNQEAVKFYTAMPSFEVLMLLFNLVSNCIPETRNRNSLTQFQQVVLTIMKLCHNFHVIDLALRFGVSRQTVSRTFHSIIGIMYSKLLGMVCWPERETFRSNLPVCFDQAFGRAITVIINCFKISVEKPSKATGETTGLTHQTLKYLVGITPQGFIYYVSKGFEGKCSVQFAAEKIRFLEHLQPGDVIIGDVIMADRNVLPDDMIGFYYAKLNLKNGFEAMRCAEVDRIPKIANISGHAERIIKSLKHRFSLLDNVVNGFTIESGRFDQVVSVCCSLNNFCIKHKTDMKDMKERRKIIQEALDC